MTEFSGGGSFDTLSDFVSIAKGVIATGQNLDEANTKAKIVTPFIRTLGWHVYDNSEVLLEYSGEAEFEDRVDYALFGPEGVYAVIEAKQIGRSIEDKGTQIRRYMRLFGAEWGLLTNGEEYFVYQANDESGETLLESVSLVDLSSSPHMQNFTRQSAYAESTPTVLRDEGSPEISHDSREAIEEFVKKKRGADQQSQQESAFGPLYDGLIDSIAPSVQGRETEKLGLLLSLVGGVRKSLENERSVRGAIHLLLVHDPGTLSTEVIESAAQIAPEAVYLSGKPSAEEFLTTQTDSHIASPSKLSDYSVDTLARASHAVVTRLDEINERGFTHMREALDPKPSGNDYSSGDWVQERPGMIASSVPKHGRFDEYEPVDEQINVAPSLITKFDLIFTVPNRPSEEQDRDIAEGILKRNHAGEIQTNRQKKK